MFLTQLNNISNIKDYDVEGFIIGIRDLSLRMNKYFEIDELPAIVQTLRESDKLVFINLNNFFTDNELDNLESTLTLISTLNVDGIYFQDLSLITINISKKLRLNLVYKPDTLVTNKEELVAYQTYIKGIVISNEIILDDINDFGSELEKHLIIHGNIVMFHSKRRLLSTYCEYTSQNLDSKNGYLIEELREEKLPIVEDSTGTSIYRGNVLQSKGAISKLKGITYYIVDNVLKDDKYTIDVINSYKHNKELPIDNYDEGFYYNKTVYIKDGGK